MISEATGRRILGLDLGTNSIGWALLGYDHEDQPKEIVGIGVRIFQEAVDSDRTPKNVARRAARGARRNLARYRMRRDRLLKQLTDAQLMPDSPEEREALLTDIKKYDPYRLRAEGLDRELTPFEFGRVLFHLNQRRGFQSNRKQQLKSEDGVVKESITALRKSFGETGARTLGEFLLHQTRRRNRPPFSDRYTERAMYREEFELLWKSQSSYKPELLTEALRAAISRTIFFQRPLKVQKYLVGRCRFEPSRKRAAWGWLETQRFRYLQDVNNLEVLDPIRRTWRTLSTDERQILVTHLEKGDLTWAKARKVLGLHTGEKFNLESSKITKLKGNRTNAALTKALGARWAEMKAPERLALLEDLLTIDTEEALLRRAHAHWQMSHEECRALLDAELEPGYASLSLKAIRRILPHLEKGLRYHEAAAAAAYDHARPQKHAVQQRLPLPPLVRNPVVQKALFEVRKVVNAIVRRYGAPDAIRIELARDLRMSRTQLQESERERRRRTLDNEKIRQRLIDEIGLMSPSPADIEKFKLWEEVQETCPYSGEVIPASQLFTAAVEVEHIIPFSRCLDDSFQNKTIALSSANKNKGNRTPYEMFLGDENGFALLLQRIAKLSPAKRRRFEQKEVVLNEFVSRQLNDTRYISRLVKDYVAQLGTKVEVGRGQLTALLRHTYGLNRILSIDGSGEKNRADHRHHAVDAVVVALTSPSLLCRVSTASARRSEGMGRVRVELPLPWPTLRSDLEQQLERMVVSHAAQRRISGAFHEGTAYGLLQDEGEWLVLRVRKPLSSLTQKQAQNIVDPIIRAAVLERLRGGSDASKEFATPLQLPDGSIVRRVRIAVRKSRSSTLAVQDAFGRPYKYFLLGNNHHAAIYEKPGIHDRDVKIVSTFEAARRVRRSNLPLVARDGDEEWSFVSSLCANDMVAYEPAPKEVTFYRVQNISTSSDSFDIRLRHHSAAGALNRSDIDTVRIRSRSALKLVRKVEVSPLGEISPCND